MDYRQAAQNAILEDCIAASGNWIHAGKVVDRVALLVEAAVVEERERCAGKAENYRSACGHACWNAIAAEIRKPTC